MVRQHHYVSKETVISLHKADGIFLKALALVSTTILGFLFVKGGNRNYVFGFHNCSKHNKLTVD